MKKRHLISNYESLITSEVKSFLCQLIIWISSSVIYLFISFTIFIFLIFYLFCWLIKMFLFWILILSILCIENIFCQSHFLRNLEKSFRVLLCKNISPNYQLEYSLIPVPESSTIYPKSFSVVSWEPYKTCIQIRYLAAFPGRTCELGLPLERILVRLFVVKKKKKNTHTHKKNWC